MHAADNRGMEVRFLPCLPKYGLVVQRLAYRFVRNGLCEDRGSIPLESPLQCRIRIVVVLLPSKQKRSVQIRHTAPNTHRGRVKQFTHRAHNPKTFRATRFAATNAPVASMVEVPPCKRGTAVRFDPGAPLFKKVY